MVDVKLISMFRSKQFNSGHSIKYFVDKFLTKTMKYNTVVSQINGFNPISEELRKAILNYLEENDEK